MYWEIVLLTLNSSLIPKVVQPLNLDVFLLLVLQRANGLAPMDVMVNALRFWDKANTGFIDKEKYVNPSNPSPIPFAFPPRT